MESSRETEERKAQKHMMARPTGGYAKIRKALTTAGERSKGQKAVEGSCGWLMPLKGATGVRRKAKESQPAL